MDKELLIGLINMYGKNMYKSGEYQAKADASPIEQRQSAYQESSDEMQKLAEACLSDIVGILSRA